MRPAALLALLSRCPGAEMNALDTSIDLSVNDATAEVLPSGPSALRLVTAAGANPPGGFAGDGVGNKAIAGLPGFDGAPLSTFNGLSFRVDPGTAAPYANLVVDLGCDGAERVLVVASGAPVGADGAVAYAAGDAVWRAVGGLDALLPGHLESAAGRLADVVAACPSACLRDADTRDAGLPAGELTEAGMIILGDSRNQEVLEQRVLGVQIGPVRYRGF